MMELSGAVLEHANRGLRLQLLLRAALVVFVALTLILIPPVQASGTLFIIVAVYAACAAVFMRWAWDGGPSVARWGWLGLFADLAMLTLATLIAGVDAHESWTSDVLVIGFFLLPVLAATQLRPGICAAVVLPTTAVYAIASVATQAANEEPWESIGLRTFMLASVGAAAVGLSRIQRSRVFTIGGLLEDRTTLLDDLVHLEERESRELSERLHDGALQYVLAARLDLDDVRGSGNEEAVDRIERALAESTRMLRSTVSELNPAVLEHAGLARAVQDLAIAQARGDLTVTVDADDWPARVRTPVDALLFSAARELLANVVRHAGARHAMITVGLSADSARLVVTDDGKGITESARKASLDAGHIGLHSQRLRIEAAGGTLTVSGGSPGTVATVVVPVRVADDVSSPQPARR